MALNRAPNIKFTEAISLFVNCETQEEVDALWAKLSEGGQGQPCGWLEDKFGLSWQIIPSAFFGSLSLSIRSSAGAMPVVARGHRRGAGLHPAV